MLAEMLATIFSADAIVVVIVVVAVLFGGTQIPKLARSLGSARSEFKRGLAEVQEPSVVIDGAPEPHTGGTA
jgi:sec-independent protein translocase protein TatA